MGEWRSQRTGQISLATVALLIGTAAGQLKLMVPLGLVVLAIATCFITCRWRLGLVVVTLGGFGFWHGSRTTFDQTPLGREAGRTVTLVGIVSDDPSINAKNQVSFTLGDVHRDGRALHQNVQVLTTYKTLQRGYQVSATGKVEQGLGATPAALAFAPTTVLSTKIDWLEQLRQRFFTGVRSAMPEPLSGFSLGLLIGARALIDKPLQATLNAVGLSHLIAVSGYNLTIIIQAVRRVLSRASTFAVTAVSGWLILGFLLVAGFGASIVRAAMVSMIGLLAAYYGYEPSPLTLVMLPAAVTVAWRPWYLLHDAGWQLSFLAFFGIMVVAPLLERRFVRRPTPVKLLVLESLAAQITTAPLILGVFGNFSVISPLSNAVVLPFVPLAMLLSFVAGGAAIVAPAAAAWMALPAAGLLGLMIGLVQWFAGLPSANLHLGSNWQMVAGLYVCIGLGVAVLRRANQKIPTSP